MDVRVMLQKTTRYGLKGHYHIVYLRKDGTGLCSTAKGHTHDVAVQPPQMDPMTGQEMGAPTWALSPAEDGHTHELAGNPDLEESKDGLDDDAARVELVRDYLKKDEEYERDSRKKAEEADKFYRGEQWDDQVKDDLEASDRPALTINLIQPAVDVLTGYQRQNRTDIKFFPVEDGDSRVADILSAVVKNVCERNDFAYTESAVFEDQAIAGRGFYHAYADYERDIRGEVVIERYNWDEVYVGPHEKLDLSDCERVTKAKWYTLEKLKQLYPDKAEGLTEDWAQILAGGNPSREYDGRYGDQYEMEAKNGTSNPMFVNLKKKELRVLDCERRLYKRVPVFVYGEDDFVAPGNGWKSSDVAQVKTIPGFRVIERPANKMQRLMVAGGTLLENTITDEQEFSIIPVYAKRRGHDWWGKVEGAKDPQREVNKRHSQSVDIINKMTSHMWFYDQRTFADAREERKFEEGASRPGLKVKLQDVKRPPTRSDGAPMPQGVVEMEENAVGKLQAILAVNPALLGTPNQGQAASSMAIIEGKKTALTGNEFLFDNLSYGKRRLGLRLVKLIQQVYTPDRIIRLLVNMNARQPVQVGGQPLMQYQPQELVDLLQNEDLTKYDVVVGESNASPTTRLANYSMLTEMAGKGIPIPPDMVIEASPMPEEMRSKAMQSLQMQQQAAKEAEDRKYQMEIGKTAIAKGGRPAEGGQQQQPQGMTPDAYMKMQLDMEKLRLERDKMAADIALEREKMSLEREKLEIERLKLSQPQQQAASV